MPAFTYIIPFPHTRAFSERDSEVKSQRLTDEELKRIQEEHAKKEATLSELRKERAKKMMEDMKQRELEEATPKARSALAARWEEQVRTRSGGGKLTTSQNKATVMSDVSPIICMLVSLLSYRGLASFPVFHIELLVPSPYS